MKIFNKNLLWLSIATLALTGCGSSNNSSSSDGSDDHDHEHDSSILVSQANTTNLSLLEDGVLEALDDAAAGNSAKLVLSESGAYAAVLSSGTVNFIHGLHEEEDHDEDEHGEEEHEEAHVLEYSLSGTDISVVPTSGHFAVLVDGDTTFIEYDELVNEARTTESTSGLSVDEVYPALILDEQHDLKLVFDDTDALVYEGTSPEDSFACANPTSHGQTDELVVVSCDEGARALVIEEDELDEHTFTSSLLDLDGTDSNYIWRAQGHVIVGFEPNTSNYAIVELDESGATPSVAVVEGADTGTVELSRKICDIKLDSEEQDVLILVAGDATNAGDKLVVLNHEGEERKSVTINSSTDTDCGNLVMASASKNVLVVDNIAQEAYDIDAHESDTGSVNYHIHSTYELDVTDIADVVIFHEMDEENHDHDH